MSAKTPARPERRITVLRDLAGERVCSPEQSTGLDGKSYPARREPRPEAAHETEATP